MTPAALVKSLPQTIRIGAHDIEIRFMTAKESEKHFGDWDQGEMTIALHKAPKNKLIAVDTFMHEINHAIYQNAGLENGETEELIVNVLTQGWLQIYRDNAWVLPWLQEALKK